MAKIDARAAGASVGSTLLMGLASLSFPFGPDQGVFALVGRTILEGGMPIRDALDVKPPLVYLLYGLSEAAFGPHLWSVRLLDLLLTALTALALSLWMPNRRSAIAVALLYPLIYYGCFFFADTAQAEGLSNAFVAIGLYFAFVSEGRHRFLLAGALVALAALAKSTNALFLLPLLVSALRVPRAPAHALLGFLTPVALTVVWFYAMGAKRSLIDMVVFQREYAENSLGRVSAMAGHAWQEFVLATPGFGAFLILAFALFCLSRNDVVTARRGVFWWALVSVAIVLVQLRFYTYHFVVLVPPAVAAFGLAVSTMRSPRALLATSSAAALVIALNARFVSANFALAAGRLTPEQYAERAPHPAWYVVSDTHSVVEWITADGGAGETAVVYAFDPAIYWLAELRPVSRHINTAPIFGETQIDPGIRLAWAVELYDDMRERRPTYFVGHPGFVPAEVNDYRQVFATGHYVVLKRP